MRRCKVSNEIDRVREKMARHIFHASLGDLRPYEDYHLSTTPQDCYDLADQIRCLKDENGHEATVWSSKFMGLSSCVADEDAGRALFLACYKLMKEVKDDRE